MNIDLIIGTEINTKVFCGNSWKLVYVFQDKNGVAIPLNNAKLLMQVKRSYNSASVDAEFSLIDGANKGITVDGNKVTIGDFMNLAGGIYKSDLLIVMENGFAFTAVFGTITATPRVSSLPGLTPTATSFTFPPIVVKLNTIYNTETQEFVLGDELGNPILSDDHQNTIQ
jgi:hypothetical protein